MTEGLVSTVIPVHNRAAMLREAVASVLAQTWRPLEIIIVDDGSTDDTHAVEAQLAQCYAGVIRVLRQANAGPGVARQHGLSAARGEFIQFLDSDDLLLPQKFDLEIAGLREDPEADIAYGKAYTSVNGVRLPDPAYRTGECLRLLFPTLLQEPIWPTMTPLYRHSALLRVGSWPSKRQLEDWEYDAQAGAIGLKLHYVNAFVAETRSHGEARLCYRWRTDDAALRDMADAYKAVHTHAMRAGVKRDTPEMQRYSRSLFLMARRAAARGLANDARELIDLARSISPESGWELTLFEVAAAIFGWRRTSVWAERLAAMTR